MQSRAAFITGISGGIGVEIGRAFRDAGYFVIGSALTQPPSESCDYFIEADVVNLTRDEASMLAFKKAVDAVVNVPISVLVNNAAVQFVYATADISLEDWDRTLAVNLTAPFRLAQIFLDDLRSSKGTILNIGSVHAQSTKPNFVAYATSKAALHGLTRALAVDLGPDIKVVCLAPAAVSTPMLVAGFEGRESSFNKLKEMHPAGRIASPKEVADVAVFLSSEVASFATGCTFFLDGGILSRLHDPE